MVRRVEPGPWVLLPQVGFPFDTGEIPDSAWDRIVVDPALSQTDFGAQAYRP